MKKVYIAALGAFGAALALPLAAGAAPLGMSGFAAEQARTDQSNIVQVQYRVHGGRNFQRDGRAVMRGPVYRGVRPGVRGPAFRGPRVVNRGGYGYWNGNRGYRYARPGYRYYNGWWFPAAALATGALIGGAIINQSDPVYAAPVQVYGGGELSAQHYSWCQQRYVSYRPQDNSFQPYQGPRQACVSPYS
jgi:hypothetical protein